MATQIPVISVDVPLKFQDVCTCVHAHACCAIECTEIICQWQWLVYFMPPEKLGNRLCCFSCLHSHMAISRNAFCFKKNSLFHLLLGEITNNDGPSLTMTFLHVH